MGTPFLGEVKIISFNFAPKGWALCNGQFLPINQNQALFSILGTTYGGDGRTTFALPDLRGRTPIHVGGEAGVVLGQKGGQEFHTVTISEMPAHNHFINGSTTSNSGNVNNPSGALLGSSPGAVYHSPSSPVSMTPENITNTGGSQPHANLEPYLVVGFCIALQGIFPSQN